MRSMELLSAEQAASRLGVSVARVKQLLAEGKIQAQKVGKQWIIQDSALASVTIYGKPGRPSKEKADKAHQAVKTSAAKKTGVKK